MMPLPGVMIWSFIIRKCSPSPRALILSSISRLADSFRLFCTSRTQTMRAPDLLAAFSTASVANACDLPEPRPPYAALYRDAPMNGSNSAGIEMLTFDKIHVYLVANLAAMRRINTQLVAPFCGGHA